MKNLKFGFLALALTTFFWTSCTDPCKDVECNFGTCVEGECACNPGYEGTNCDEAFNAKFAGTYSNAETCDSSTAGPNYNVVITKSETDPLGLTIGGLWAEPTTSTLSAEIASDNSSEFEIPKIVQYAGYNVDVWGTGEMTSTGVSIDYTIYHTGTTDIVDRCVATMTK